MTYTVAEAVADAKAILDRRREVLASVQTSLDEATDSVRVAEEEYNYWLTVQAKANATNTNRHYGGY